jgi:hypothetical protein
MLKRLLAVFTAMLLTLATFAFAAELRQDHPDTYTVKKGDTLWDISARFLQKPWLWPEIWQANPQVKNPHLIYPGDVLSLVYINGQARLVSNDNGPQIHSGEAISSIPLAELEPYVKQLTIVSDPKSLPYVVGLEEDRLLSSSGQVAYVRGLANPQPGDEVQIARPISVFALGRVKNGRHVGGVSPLDFRGDTFHRHWGYLDAPYEAHGIVLGYEMMKQSIGQVTRVQGDTAIVLLKEEGREVRVGDRVMPVEEHPYDANFYPQSPTSIPDGATILAVPDGLEFSGTHNVVALSIGAADGVRNGTTFSVWHDGANRSDTVSHRNNIAAASNKSRMPDDYLGHVMVFRTFDKVSYALAMDGIRPIAVGDLLKDPDAVQ